MNRITQILNLAAPPLRFDIEDIGRECHLGMEIIIDGRTIVLHPSHCITAFLLASVRTRGHWRLADGQQAIHMNTTGKDILTVVVGESLH